jgi:hypothetical protein
MSTTVLRTCPTVRVAAHSHGNPSRAYRQSARCTTRPPLVRTNATASAASLTVTTAAREARRSVVYAPSRQRCGYPRNCPCVCGVPATRPGRRHHVRGQRGARGPMLRRVESTRHIANTAEAIAIRTMRATDATVSLNLEGATTRQSRGLSLGHASYFVHCYRLPKQSLPRVSLYWNHHQHVAFGAVHTVHNR